MKENKTIIEIFVHFRELGVILMVVGVFILASIIEPRFLRFENIRSILLYTPLIMVVAMGMLMVMVSGNIDLSVGSNLAFCGILVGLIFIKNPDFPIWLAFVLGSAIGAGLGAFNGFLVTVCRLPAIIATLATLNLYRGLLFIIGGGRQIDPNYIPDNLIKLSQTSPIKIPWVVIFAVIIATCTFLFLKYSHTGKEIYAIGSNLNAAKLRGINVKKVLMIIFIIVGACSGFAGILYASRYGYVNPGITGVGFEFVVISATVIGGTSVAGGTGSVLGVVLGALLLGTVNTSLAVLGVSAFWQQAIYGMIIIIALLIDKGVHDTLTKEAIRRSVKANE